MIDKWVDMITKIGIFMIFSQTLIHCCPKSEYVKYINMIVEIMLISMIAFPVLSFIFGFTTKDYQNKIQEMEKLFYEIEEGANRLNIPDESLIRNQLSDLLEEYNE